MADYIYSLILLVVALVCIELRKSYHAVPKIEIRRMARQGDKLAEKIYSAVAYEESLELFLWIVIILCAAGSLILFNRVAPLWLDFIAVILFIWVAFAWLPKRRVDSFSRIVAEYFTPVVIWLLNYLQPMFKLVNKLGSKSLDIHTGLYDKNDLLQLIDRQIKQSDNRIDIQDLELIKRGLKLPNKKVGSYCTSWSKVHHTLAHEAMGPILLDELHKSGQLFIPVLEDNQTKKVIGMINTGVIDIAKAGEVRDLMDNKVYYLNEDDSLTDAVNAVTQTGSPVFIVLDKKERLTGLITFKDIVSQLISLEPKTKLVIPENHEES